MNILDPNAQQAPANQEAIAEQPANEQAANAQESKAQDAAMEATQDSEEGSIEG